MLARKQKSAIINVSSTMGAYPYAGSSIYAATKTFVDFFSLSLGYELGGKIDV